MPTRWSFFAFDWKRFAEIEPILRRAGESADFSSLGIPDADPILERLGEDATPEEAANELVMELCGVGEALFFESGVPELIRGLRKNAAGEEAGDILAELISAEPNVEGWFRAEAGLVGILLPGQTKELSGHLERFRKYFKPPPPPRGLAGFARRLTTNEPAHDHLIELIDLVREAANKNHGLGALRES